MEEQEEGALSDEVRADAITIYPNPTNGMFTVRVMQPGGYEILNGMGQLQQSITVMAGEGSFDVASLAAGVYFIREVRNPANLQRVIVVE
jgi:hypothetical protein